jgi:hypothetical protein
MQVFTYMQYTLIGPIIDSEKVWNSKQPAKPNFTSLHVH